MHLLFFLFFTYRTPKGNNKVCSSADLRWYIEWCKKKSNAIRSRYQVTIKNLRQVCIFLYQLIDIVFTHPGNKFTSFECILVRVSVSTCSEVGFMCLYYV